MDKVTQYLILDLVQLEYNIISAKVKDSLTRNIEVTITNNGYPYEIPKNAKINLQGTRSDGSQILTEPLNVLENGSIDVPLTAYILNCSGRQLLEIQIVDGDAVVKTASFYLHVPDGVFDEYGFVKEDEGGYLSKLIDGAESSLEYLEDKIKEIEVDTTLEIVSKTQPIGQALNRFWLKPK